MTVVNMLVYLVLRLALFLILYGLLSALAGSSETPIPFLAALVATPFVARLVLPGWTARVGLTPLRPKPARR